MTRIAIIAAACFVVGNAHADYKIPTHADLVRWCEPTAGAGSCVGVWYTLILDSNDMLPQNEEMPAYRSLDGKTYSTTLPTCPGSWYEAADPLPDGVYDAVYQVSVEKPAEKAMVDGRDDIWFVYAGETRYWACVQ